MIISVKFPSNHFELRGIGVVHGAVINSLSENVASGSIAITADRNFEILCPAAESRAPLE